MDSTIQSNLQGSAVPTGRRRAGQFALILFLVALVFPIQIYAGPFRLPPYRIVLLLFVVPCLLMWFSGRAGRVRAADVLILCHALWAAAALIIAHGLESSIETAGIYFIEVMSPYLLARCFIRSRADFNICMRTIFIIIAAMLPFVAYESFTGNHIINTALGSVFTVFPAHDMNPRWGLERAFGPFGHPIHYGVFCATPLGLISYALYRKGARIMAFLRPATIVAATFFSLSAGPLVALVAQIALIVWDRVARRIPHRWQIIGIMVLAAYVTVDIVSNRTPVEVFISYLTFSEENSYNRVNIWNYGIAEVIRNPVFGIGLNEWRRAEWMSASMDNFWLLLAVRDGIPGFLMFALAVILLCMRLGRARFAEPFLNEHRRGWLISICGFVIAGTTVHYWNAIFCFFMFLLGSGVWMLDHKSTVPTSSTDSARNVTPVGVGGGTAPRARVPRGVRGRVRAGR